MGTVASLVAADAQQAAAAVQVAIDVLNAADLQFSSYRPDSELSRFNRGEVAPSDRLREVLAACDWLSQESDGRFNTQHAGSPEAIDVAGYVKGWAVDQAAQAVTQIGITQFALGVGGDWCLRGGHPDGRPWRWAVLDPATNDRGRAVVAVQDGAIATSGTYERGAHLHGSAPGSSVASFTVVGPQLRWADAFATIGYVMGGEGMSWVSRYQGYSAALIEANGTMIADETFPLVAGSDFPDVSAPYLTG